jgi:NAD(P)-dependent dehydrogenase (short-subunit alcohol dehydrogenase family)
MDLGALTRWYDLTGQTAVITGGAGILGSEMVHALVGCGANVAIVSRHPSRAEGLLRRLENEPGRAISVCADVRNRETLRLAEESIRAELGAVGMLINAAGGNSADATTGEDLSFFDLPEDALRHVVDLNLLGTILSCQVFGQGMSERGEGAIVNLSSMNAIRPLTRIPAYSAAKAAVGNFTQWLAVHMAREYSPNIRVNALAPGFFLTEQNRFLLTDEASDELTPRGRSIIEHTPMGRFGDAEDLLGALLWLLSPASAFVTGVVVPVDGGFSAFGGV